MSVNLYNATTDTLKNVGGDIINPKSVNEMIAPIENGTASKSYAVGEQFIMNDLLCEATQAIAQGDTMVIGTNCEESEQLSKQIKDINNDLTDKVERMTNVSGYQTVDVLGYNPTTKKLGLKVNGADTVIPFNSGISNTFSYSLVNNKGGNTDVDIFIPQDVSSITINYTAKSSYVSAGVYVDGTFHDVTSSPITYPVSTKITLHIYDQYTSNSATFKVIFNN